MMRLLVIERNSYVDPQNLSRSMQERVIAPLKAISNNVQFDIKSEHQQIELKNYDAVFFSRHKSEKCLEIAIQAAALRKKIFYDLDDWVFEFPKNSISGWSARDIERSLEIMRTSTTVITSTEFLAHTLRSNQGIESSVVPTGIDFKEFDFNKKLSHKSNKIVFVNGDNLKLENFKDVFFKSINSFLETHLSFQLDIYADTYKALTEISRFNKCGAYPWESFKEVLLEPNYLFGITPLIIDEDDAPSSFYKCKSPIKYYLFGSLMIPGIYSKSEIYKDVVVDRETGLLVDNTYDAWASAINELIHNDKLRQKIAINAFQDVKKKHHVSISAQKIHSLLSK